MSLGEEQRALLKALESGETDLVYLVLFRMYRTLPLGDFLACLNAKPQARALFTAYCARKARPCSPPPPSAPPRLVYGMVRTGRGGGGRRAGFNDQDGAGKRRRGKGEEDEGERQMRE